MKILLATLHVRRSRQAVPLAAACLAASLPADLRDKTRLLDLFPDQSGETMLDRFLAEKPDLVSFSVYAWNRKTVMHLAGAIRCRSPQTVLVAGGPEAAADPLSFLQDGIFNGVICGDGEPVFPFLAQTLNQGNDPAGLPGLTWRGGSGPVAGPDLPGLPPDRMPSPWLGGILQPSEGVLWETSRGCPFACDYCFDSGGRGTVRHLPWPRLEAELDLFARSGVSQVWVLDSTFNFPPEHGKTLLKLIRRKAPHIHFHLEGKAEFLDREMIRLLSEIDSSLQLGLQSFHPAVLRHVGRGFDPEDFCRKAERLSAESVVFGLDLIYGLPGDNLEGFRDSLDAALRLAPNHLDIFRLAVLPGTVLHRQQKKHGMVAQQEAPYEILESSSYSRTDLTASELLAATTRLLYNTGRAVGFFLPLVAASGHSPLSLLDHFQQWLLTERNTPREDLLAVENWTPEQVLTLQEDFIEQLFPGRDKKLHSLALDLVHYHYHYAETLLGSEVLPPEPEQMRPYPLMDTPWQCNPLLRLVNFAYEIGDLLDVGDVDLRELVRLLRPVGSTALFLRRGSEVACESLEDGFLALLKSSNGTRTPRRIFPDGDLAEVEQWVDFAVAEGLLLPP